MKFTEARDRISLKSQEFHQFNELSDTDSHGLKSFLDCVEGLQEKSKPIMHDDFSGLQTSHILMNIPYEKLK